MPDLFDRDTLAAFLEWIRSAGLLGAALVVLAYIPAAILFVPASVLTLGAGFVFGVVKGAAIVSVGSTAGAAAAFLVSRTIGQKWVARRVAKRPALNAIFRAVHVDAFRVVLLTRLSPVFPYNVLNYAFGLSAVPFRTYVLASWIGMLPGTLMYSYIGSAAQSVASLVSGTARRSPAQQVFFLVGLAATIAVTAIVTRTARRALGAIVSPP
jgi:uncharacterized membrane protein YdjX (TVP38/TMEM64 family)